MEKMKLDIQMFASLLKSWSTYWIATNTSSPRSFCDAKGYIKVYLVSQNTSNNSSYIRIDHYIVISSDNDYGTMATGITSSYRANNGSFGGSYQSATSSQESKSGSGTGTYLLGSTYHTVNHSSDGTANLYVNGSINAYVYSLYDDGETHYSATRTSSFSGVTLPTIPRASTISDNVSTVEIGQNYAMTIGSKAVSGYTLKLYYQLNSGSEVLIDDDVSAGTYNYELPSTLIESLPSATSGTFKAILKTYNGATLIGSNSVTITVTVPASYVPTCSLAISDTNAITSAWGIWVKGKSILEGVITAEGVSGSTITSYSTPANGSIYTTAEFTTNALSTIGEQTITATAKDTRLRTASDSEEITVVDYSAPTYSKVEVKRCLANGTLDEEGTYGKVVCQYSISPCGNNNAKSLKVVLGATEKTFSLTNYSGTYTADTDELFENLSASSKYNFEFYLIDSFEEEGVPQTYTMPTASVTVSLLNGGNGAAYGKIATEEETLDCAWSINTDEVYKINGTNIFELIYPVGSIYMSVSSTNPSTLFGGTWAAWGSGRVPVGIDTEQTEFNTVEKTGGAKTHTLTTDEMPSHFHYTGNPNSGGSSGWYQSSGNKYSSTATTNPAGGGQAHNNLQPYIVCYMWERTA